MSLCHCEQCRPDDPAPSYTRAFAWACEVRFVAAMPLELRRAHLREMEKTRGAAGVAAMKSALAAVFAARREQHTTGGSNAAVAHDKA